jgi:hypothetical protein
VNRYGLWAALVAVASLGASLLGGPHRRAALTGSSIASATAVISLVAMGRASRSAAAKPVKTALAVMAVMFLLRIALVGLATALVSKAGDNVFAFVIAFFVPYFIFSAIEGAYVHALGRETGPTA